MRIALILIFSLFCLEAKFYAESGKYYTNEGFRAAAFGAKSLARDLFYKACILGDNVGCYALNEINAPLKAESSFINKQECSFGDKDACFAMFEYYINEFSLDSFKANWYLSKACRLGKIEACELESKRIKPFIKDRRELLTQACFYNDARACYELGNIYLYAKGVTRNIAYAKDMMKKACKLGLKNACADFVWLMR